MQTAPMPSSALPVPPGPAPHDVAWYSIIGGAFAAIALTIILAPLGAALGFASASPWHTEPGKVLTMASAIWLIIVQWLSAGVGGYLTGRLRTPWAGAHMHEIFFRDTVHGFLAWALATIAGALLIMTVATHLAGHAVHANHEDENAPTIYFADSLFRTDTANANYSEQDLKESSQILGMAMANGGNLSDSDKNYLSHLVAARTSMSVPDAEKRVDDTLAQQKVKFDQARKAAATTSLFVTLSLLIGAFIACVAGACGGHHREAHYTTGSICSVDRTV